jgi:tetratricopeptide (TPR) repeat protein
MSADLAAQALALVKAGDCAAALALIEALPVAAQREETVARTYALALAQTNRLTEAIEVLQPLLNQTTPTLATTALAARLFEDTSRHAEAFSHYVQLASHAPQQYGFWRGVWRCVVSLDSGDQEKDIALTASRRHAVNLASDEQIAADVIRALRRKLRSQDVETLVSVATAAREKYPDHAELSGLTRKVLVDALPLTQRPVAADFHRRKIDKRAMAEASWLPVLFRDDDHIEHWRAAYRAGLEALNQAIASGDVPPPRVINVTAFALAYHGRSNVSLQRLRGQALTAMVAPLTPPTTERRASSRGRKIRVGFVSKHIRDCTVGHYFKRFFTDLGDDHIAVEVFAVGDTDAFTDNIADRVSQLYRFPLKRGDDDSDDVLRMIATAVAARELDVLIYPEIGMEPLIEKLAAMRLAPMQCAFWGHPDTTGLPTIDTFFSAAAMEPLHSQAHYCERLVVLPGLGCAYPKPAAPDALGRAELALPNNVPLFVCAQSSFKWRPNFLVAVALLLQTNPSAKLVYFRSREPLAAYAFENYLGERLRAAGIDPAQRTIALQETTRTRFLATLAACDVALDTFDFSGGNTTLDSLSVGLPVVTRPGEFMRGRQSMAMLQIVGAPELIAQDADDYVRIASALLENTARRTHLREQLKRNSHRLFDDAVPLAHMREWLLTTRQQIRVNE